MDEEELPKSCQKGNQGRFVTKELRRLHISSSPSEAPEEWSVVVPLAHLLNIIETMNNNNTHMWIDVLEN